MKTFQNLKPMLRGGFTLVELLLVMAIIAVLATLSLAIVNDAQFEANVAATQSRINSAAALLQQKLESYAQRRAPIDLSSIEPADGAEIGERVLQREYRRRVIADIINVEMPRRLQNLAFEVGNLSTMREAVYPSQAFLQGIGQAIDGGDNIDRQSAESIVRDLSDAGSPAFASSFIVDSTDPLTSPALYPEGGAPGAILTADQITFDPFDPSSFPTLEARRTLSEYLYMIFETSNFNGISAIESLGSRSFADTDGDGYLEFVDSWGNPIAFQFEIDVDNDGATDLFGLDPGIQDRPTGGGTTTPVLGFNVNSIRVRLLSTGNGVEPITN